MKLRFFIAGAEPIFAEYRRSVLKRGAQFHINPEPILNFLELIARKVEPVILSEPGRDPLDDIFIATALAAKASYVVTHDPDLLCLEKPFGIEMIRPREFLRTIS